MLAEHVLCPLASISLMVHLYLCYAVRWASAEDAHFLPRRQQLLIPELRSARRVGQKEQPESSCRRLTTGSVAVLSAPFLPKSSVPGRGVSAACCRSPRLINQSAKSSRKKGSVIKSILTVLPLSSASPSFTFSPWNSLLSVCLIQKRTFVAFCGRSGEIGRAFRLLQSPRISTAVIRM